MKRRDLFKLTGIGIVGWSFPSLVFGEERINRTLLFGSEQLPCTIKTLSYRGSILNWLKEKFSDDETAPIHYFPHTALSLNIDERPALAFKTWEFEGFVQHLIIKIKDLNRYTHYSTPHGAFSPNGNEVFSALLGIKLPDDQFSKVFTKELTELDSGIAPLAAFGTLLGYHSGLPIYSNGSTAYFSGQRNYYDGYCTGYRWQCVEWIVRYFKALFNRSIRGGNANTFYASAAAKGLLRFSNGGTTPPQPGDIICSAGGSYGHVGVIREVNIAAGYIFFSQQNWSEGPTDVQTKMTLTVSSGRYKLAGFSSSYPVQGWLRAPGAVVLPGTVSVNPTSGSWTATPQNIAVSSSNAEQIFYTLRYTLDGSSPADPPEPTTANSAIPSGSGTFQVYAEPGQYKKLKVRFRGNNTKGYGPTSGIYSYSIDLRTPVESIKITNPTPGERWETSKSHTIRWTCQNIPSSNRMAIYYSLDNGATWYAVDEDTGNDGEKSWKMSGDSRIGDTKTARLKIVNKTNPTTMGISEPFEIDRN